MAFAETITLYQLRITGGNSPEEGGGIFNVGLMTLTDCTVRGNEATEAGGCLRNISGATLELTGCTLSENEAADGGGGIFNTGSMTLSGCTVSGNSSESDGCISNLGAVTLEDGTSVTDNEATADGGGIFNDGAAISTCLGGSSVSGNTPNDCVEANGGDCDARKAAAKISGGGGEAIGGGFDICAAAIATSFRFAIWGSPSSPVAQDTLWLDLGAGACRMEVTTPVEPASYPGAQQWIATVLIP